MILLSIPELSFLWAKWMVCQAFKGAFAAMVTLNPKLWVRQILSFSETSHQPFPALTILWQNRVNTDRNGCICCLLSHSPEYTWLCRPCHLKPSSAKSPSSADDVFDSTILSHFLLRRTIPMLNPLKWMEVEVGEGFLDAGFDKGVSPFSTKPHSSSCSHISPQAR